MWLFLQKLYTSLQNLKNQTQALISRHPNSLKGVPPVFHEPQARPPAFPLPRTGLFTLMSDTSYFRVPHSPVSSGQASVTPTCQGHFLFSTRCHPSGTGNWSLVTLFLHMRSVSWAAPGPCGHMHEGTRQVIGPAPQMLFPWSNLCDASIPRQGGLAT